ncbi:DNA polymerase IV, partial [Acidobacteriota bacterium]
PEEIEQEIFRRAEAVGYTLRKKGMAAKTVQIKIRTGDYKTWTRSKTVDHPTYLSDHIFRTAMELLKTRIETKGKGLRLIGVGVSGLSPSAGTQLRMFEEESLQKKLTAATDAVREKFGKSAITRARLIRKDRRKDPE